MRSMSVFNIAGFTVCSIISLSYRYSMTFNCRDLMKQGTVYKKENVFQQVVIWIMIFSSNMNTMEMSII